MSDQPTPETDAAIKESKGQWSFALKETCQRLERERDEAREKMADALQEVDLRMLDYERMKSERDEAREDLSQITEYGTEEINAAVELRQKLATALLERDEARSALREIAEAIGFDNIGDWARNTARKALEGAK